METELLFTDNAYETDFTAKVVAIENNTVILDKTLFYYTSGGQPGDTGVLTANDNNFEIAATVKDRESGNILHILPEDAVLPKVGDEITGKIDWETRHKHMRMHTCMHLICSLIEGDVTGGQVRADRSRLDFNIPTGQYDKESLTQQLNELIAADHPVTSRWVDESELDAHPELVRTMSVQPPRGVGKIRLLQIGTEGNMIDLQPCGGTHVKSTGEIGKMLISKIENKGKQNKRINIVFAD